LLTLGIDLGATKTKIALIEDRSNILFSRRHPTSSEKSVEEVIKEIMIDINEFVDRARGKISALGIGVAGQIDINGNVLNAPNLGWHKIPLKNRIEREIDLPVFITNDVRAATWGEWQFGSGRGMNELTTLFVGTGIGGGIVSDGHLLEGCSNTAGELGHMTIVADGRKCHCSNKGCLEAYAGGWAIAERTQEAILKDPSGGEYMSAMVDHIGEVTAATVGHAYHRGDPLAKRLVEETGRYLAAGLVTIINTLNPCTIILGGGVVEGIPELVDIALSISRRRVLEATTENLKTTKAQLGENGGVIGAADLARRRVEEGKGDD